MKIPNQIFFLLLVIFLSACRQSSHQEHTHTHEEIISQEVPQAFLKFYMKFLSDTTYQKSHIVFPLKSKADGTPWLAEEWECHRPFDDNGEFQQQFVNMNGLILETISDPKGMYKMERRYMKSNDGYDLIYFTVMNAFENSEDWDKQ